LFPHAALGLDHLTSLAVVGTSKNAGKTVAIGRLLGETAALGRAVGVLSTGMDGERRDAVFGYAKPPVTVEPGMWVATASQGLEAASAGFVVEGHTGIPTPFGEIEVARVMRDGRVTLIGPRTLSQLDRVVAALRARGADFVLVDGSIDRRSVAGAASTEAVVLVVGAAWSRDLTAVVTEAARVVRLLTLPAATGDVEGWPEAPDWIDAEGRAHASGLPSALSAEAALAQAAAQAGARTLRCPGAVPGALVDALVKAGAAPLRLLVESGTHVFADEAQITRFERAGGRLEARRPIHLAGLAINPYSPEGYWLPADELRQRVQELAPERPVFDALID